MTNLNEVNSLIMIDSYSPEGFRLNDGSFAFGPVIVFPTGVLSWKLLDYDDITDEAFAIFDVVYPKPDVIIVGLGDNSNTKSKADLFMNLRRKRGLNVEFLATPDAIATYNFMVSENRAVAAAMAPPSDVGIRSDQDVWNRNQSGRDGLYRSLDHKGGALLS